MDEKQLEALKIEFKGIVDTALQEGVKEIAGAEVESRGYQWLQRRRREQAHQRVVQPVPWGGRF